MIRDLLKDADVHTMGMLLESGASGSLHMTFSSDVIRRALQQPLPPSATRPIGVSFTQDCKGAHKDAASSACGQQAPWRMYMRVLTAKVVLMLVIDP